MLRLARNVATKQVVKEIEFWKFPGIDDYDKDNYNFDSKGEMS